MELNRLQTFSHMLTRLSLTRIIIHNQMTCSVWRMNIVFHISIKTPVDPCWIIDRWLSKNSEHHGACKQPCIAFLFKSLFRRTSRLLSKLCEGHPSVSGGYPSHRDRNLVIQKTFPGHCHGSRAPVVPISKMTGFITHTYLRLGPILLKL